MNFNTHLAKYVNQNYSISQLPEIAIFGLEENLNSESLEILAGMNESDNSFEILQYFEKTLIELKYTLPSKRKAALIYSDAILDEITSGTKNIIEGINEIKNDTLGNYDFYSESVKFVYDSIGFEKIYGLYVDYYDNIDKEKIKNQIIVELGPELIKWKSRLKIELEKSIE